MVLVACGGLQWGRVWVEASVHAMLQEERQALFLLELMSPTVDGEEDGCVASAFHRAVCFFSVGVLDLISTVVAWRSKTKVIKEMSDATGCICLVIAE